LIRGLSALIVTGICTLYANDVFSDDSTERAWQCTNQGLERKIELYQRNRATLEGELACWVVYTKNGESEVLWRAKNNPDYCEARAIRLVEKLQGGGFKCLATDRAAVHEQRDTGSQAVTDDTDDLVPAALDDTDNAAPAAPPEESRETPDSTGIPESTAEEFRKLLEMHYVGSYLDAMLMAMPRGFYVQPGMDALSSGRGDYLHVAPPNNFVNTMSDGSYVLVNTMLFERGATSSYVNVGFQVQDKRFRFLGYATTRPAADIKILDADQEKVEMSVAPAASDSCTPTHRTQTITWHSDVYGRYGSEPGQTTGEAGDSDCVD